MRIFLYEYCCSGALAQDSPLRAEGYAMLQAVHADFQLCPQVEAVTLLDAELTLPGTCISCPDPEHEESLFRDLTRQADWTLVIAPETEDILASRCEMVERGGGRLLGCGNGTVRQTADKLALAHHLQHHGVPTPKTSVAQSRTDRVAYPTVCKPRDGAGSQATFVIHDSAHWARCWDESWPGERIVQPFISGTPVSVSAIAGSAGLWLCPAARQHLSDDGRLHYLGGSILDDAALAARAQRLAQNALATVPGVLGFVGVDLILGASSDGSDDFIIEINPRLTTSYVGLRRCADFNLADAMLQVAAGQSPISWKWKPIAVSWSV